MRTLYIITVFLFTAVNLWGQQTIERSAEKVKVDGKIFYAHTVKKKETLYSLSKAYNVTIEEITKHNNSVTAGLKAGSILYIPVVEESSQAVVDTQSSSDEREGVSADVVKPSVATRLKAEDESNKKYKKHTVRWFEDINDISKKYNVPVEAIISLNNLSGGKLKARQVLYIPDNKYINALNSISGEDEVNEQDQEDNLDQNGIHPDEYGSFDGLRKRGWNESVEIACILPLNSKDTNNINSNFMDFYAGALLAVNDCKNSGATIKVNIYDQSDYTPLHTIVNVPGFEDNKLIIGPVREKDLKEITGYSLQNQVPLASPLDNNAEKLLVGNRYFIQMPANAGSQISNTLNLLEKVKSRDTVSTVLLIYEKGNRSDSLYVNRSISLLESKGISYIPISYGILEGRDIYSVMLSKVDTLSPHAHIALVPSNSEAFVSDVIRNLDLCTKSGARITLFGLPKWRNFETINVELFHKMKLHISLPYFVDYENEVVRQFLHQYRALYSTEPTPFAYQGYDVTKYLLEQMLEYGNSFVNAQALKHVSLLQSDFELVRDGNNSITGPDAVTSGFKNIATRNIVYKPDFTIEVIR